MSLPIILVASSGDHKSLNTNSQNHHEEDDLTHRVTFRRFVVALHTLLLRLNEENRPVFIAPFVSQDLKIKKNKVPVIN